VVVNFVITEGIDEKSPQCPPGDGTLIKLNPKPVSGSSGYRTKGARLELIPTTIE
jgi:hypothetical protein